MDPIPGPSPSGKGGLYERGPGGGGRWRVSPVRLSCSILFSTSGNQARHPCGGFGGLEERFCRAFEWPSIYKGRKTRFSARIRRVRVWSDTKFGGVGVWMCGSVGAVRAGEAFAHGRISPAGQSPQMLRPVGPPPTTSHLFCGHLTHALGSCSRVRLSNSRHRLLGSRDHKSGSSYRALRCINIYYMYEVKGGGLRISR